jgi:hypothetical protein
MLVLFEVERWCFVAGGDALPVEIGKNAEKIGC